MNVEGSTMAVCKGGYEFLILKGPIGVMVDEGPLHQLRVLARSTPKDRGLQKKVHIKGYGSEKGPHQRIGVFKKGSHQGIWVLKKVHTKGYGSSNTALVI